MLVKGSFEDFFYILIGLIWVAFSIYKGMQKKKAQNAPAEKVKKKSVLETLMDEFLEEQKPAQTETIVYQAPSQEIIEQDEKTEVFSYDDIYEQSNYSEVSEVNTIETSRKNKPKTNFKTPARIRKKPKFDLRKAVIYSEILNKRYT